MLSLGKAAAECISDDALIHLRSYKDSSVDKSPVSKYILGPWWNAFVNILPLWLAPVQVVVATITNDADEYAAEVVADLRAAGLRAEADLRNEKINFKVREHSHLKVPAMLVVGKREVESRQVALRRLGGKAQEILALEEAVTTLKSDAAVPSV